MRVLLGLVAILMMVAPAKGVTIQQSLPAVSPLVWTKPDRFWFRKTVQGGNMWFGVDAKLGAKEQLFDHKRLAIELGIRTGYEFSQLGLPLADPAAQFVVRYDGSNDYMPEGAMAIEFIFDASHWHCELQMEWNWGIVPPTDYECRKGDAVDPGGSDRPIAAPTTVRSPDGLWDAAIENNNVVVRPAGGNAPTQKLSTDGTAAFGYQLGSITWAADSKTLAAYRVHEQVWLDPSLTAKVKAQLQRAVLTVK